MLLGRLAIRAEREANTFLLSCSATFTRFTSSLCRPWIVIRSQYGEVFKSYMTLLCMNSRNERNKGNRCTGTMQPRIKISLITTLIVTTQYDDKDPLRSLCALSYMYKERPCPVLHPPPRTSCRNQVVNPIRVARTRWKIRDWSLNTLKKLATESNVPS